MIEALPEVASGRQHDAFLVRWNRVELRSHGPLSSGPHATLKHDNVPHDAPEPAREVLQVVLALGQDAGATSKLGASLLQDAVNRAVVVSQNAGVRALLVHALHDRAKEFYEQYGFQSSPLHPMTLMLRLNTRKP